jgi:hypothetical protein
MFSTLPRTLVAILLCLWVVAPVFAGTPAPQGTEVYIISPQDGAVVSNPVRVQSGRSIRLPGLFQTRTLILLGCVG